MIIGDYLQVSIPEGQDPVGPSWSLENTAFHESKLPLVFLHLDH